MNLTLDYFTATTFLSLEGFALLDSRCSGKRFCQKHKFAVLEVTKNNTALHLKTTLGHPPLPRSY